MNSLAYKIDILVIGGGQAGLSAAYHLGRLGLKGGKGYLVLDKSPQPGGAWQFRWPTLTMRTINRLHDLPGMGFAEVLDPDQTEVRAAEAVPAYFRAYEDRFHLPVYRPVTVRMACDRGDRLRVEVTMPRTPCQTFARLSRFVAYHGVSPSAEKESNSSNRFWNSSWISAACAW